MANQTILFTVLPRGIAVNAATLPVSVLVSPRLQGADRLGEFPDWLDWTGRLRDDGLELALRCGAQTRTVEVDPTPLRPALWGAMFDERTFVRSHTSQTLADYADRAIVSYPNRVALSVLKSTYQEAAVALALPEREALGDDDDRQHSPKRHLLKGLMTGLEVNWNERDGERLRKEYRDSFRNFRDSRAAPRYDPDWLAADGTFKQVPPVKGSSARDFRRGLAEQFGLFTHMPQGAPVHANPPDFRTLIDFHQALSSLSSFPDLLRALGLVLDFELPADFVAVTPPGAPTTLAVVDVRRQWAIPTKAVPDAPPLETAYLHFTGGDAANPFRLFTTAPGVLGGGLQDLEVFGLLNLEPVRYGIAQVDVDSGMHKTTLLAESWQDGREGPSFPDHPEVFDETVTLPSLRSGGFSLFADARALRLTRTFQAQKGLDAAVEGSTASRPLFAEDVTHGYRVDVWDSFTRAWHSLHRRTASFDVAGVPFAPEGESEGFTELAAAQAAPDPANPPPNDLYLHESMARWTGWSLSVPFPGRALARDVDPKKALDDEPAHPPNEPATPFKMSTRFDVVPLSLPALRFGRRYRFRLRAVDIAGNGLGPEDPLAAALAQLQGLPLDAEGVPYLRYEPVAAPTVVLRDARGVTGPGSQLHRLVIRTFNDGPAQDAEPADTTAGDRFIVPPSTSVEMGERMGMFDRDGRLDTREAMYDLIGERDKGKIDEVELVVAGGEPRSYPLVAAESLDALPYLPDVLSRAAALRDLPGSPAESLAAAEPGAGAAAALDYRLLADANPRPGSAALVGFGGGGDWQRLLPFRLALADGASPPAWDPEGRVLTVSLPKGTSAVVPLSSYLRPDDLKLLGVWQWLREHVDKVTARNPDVPVDDARLDSERIAHLLQRAEEGGHWMLTPPRLLTLVHAVKQPLGSPGFTRLSVQHEPYGTRDRWGTVDELVAPDPQVLQTAPESSPTAASELATITAWRRPGALDAHLLGALSIHAASTDKVELLAEWSDPFDDPSAPREQAREENGEYLRHSAAEADEVPVPSTREGYVAVGRGTPSFRRLAYYDADHDLLCFVRAGDRLGNLASGVVIHSDAAPRQFFDDTRRHRVTYRARATSRYREYFQPDPPDPGLSAEENDAAAAREFSRTSEPVVVDVPASARPAPPQVSYVVPTFGWQRQTATNVKRSVRFGGGLRVYLERPWFSSGEGELLGVTFWDNGNGALTDRELWKPFVTQWGADPIWSSPGLTQLPFGFHLPDRVAEETSLSLPPGAPGRVGVAGFEVAFDYERQKWLADLTLDVQSLAYTPFVRLVLVRYQPFALPDAKLSPAVVVDYVQLTPERSAVVTADPYRPRVLRLTVSGPAPGGPAPEIAVARRPTTPVTVPTAVTVAVQRRNPDIASDLAWEDAPALAAVVPEPSVDPSGLVRWTGTVRFAELPEPGTCRLVIREHEYLSANYTEDTRVGPRTLREHPKRLIYAETVEIDVALIGPPASDTGTSLGEE